MAAPFVWGSGGSKDTLDNRRRMAEALLKSGSDYSPVSHPLQGLARVAQALTGAMYMKDADASEKANNESFANALSGYLGGSSGATAPAAPVADTRSGSGNPQNALDAIMKFESGGKNVHQNIVPAGGGFNPSTGTVTGPSSAQGFFQMITPTWLSAAKMAGIDTSQYPTAMAAPYDLQRKAAASLFAKEGFAPWAPYNAALRNHIAKNGGAGAFFNDGAGPTQVADLPAPGASPVAMESGQPGFAVPPGPAPAMTGANFNAITSGQPLEPAFQSGGLSQPWMGTALPAPGPQMVQAPLPPARPNDLADIPAAGAVPAIGQMPAAAAPVGLDPNSNDAGSRFTAGGGAGDVPAVGSDSGFSGLARALTGGGSSPAPSTANPAVQSVAQAVAPQAAAGTGGATLASTPLGRLAVELARSGRHSEAVSVALKAAEAQNKPQWIEQTLPDGSLVQRNSQSNELRVVRPGIDPLDRQGKQLDIDSKKRAATEVKSPTVQRIKQPDGSEVAVQWDRSSEKWVPLEAPQGGNAVGGAPANPYALPGKPTEAQAKDAGFAGRMVESHNLINQLESVGTDKEQAARGAIPIFGNALSNDDKQKFEQAKRNFVTSILRKESGAAIAQSEFDQADKTYFPQIGDSPAVIKQKRDARELAIEGVMAGAGSGYKVPDTYKPTRSKQAVTGQTKSGLKWSVE